ncbi:uncharacterized protein [Musca autumnalis]|uniref:uncharacterized protein n=1 Tax=Musca autumnalis TaxID=221902 RepID=UPI003CE93280
MNSTKILLALGLIAVSCFTYTYALKCYSCDTKDSCKSPKKIECNYNYANKTTNYLDLHHTGVNRNTTSYNFECFSEDIKSNSGEFRYKGCIYNNINACQLPLRPSHTSGSSTQHSCQKCNTKNYCNPAGRASINGFALIALVVVGFMGRYICA